MSQHNGSLKSDVLLRHSMKRASEEAPELCHDMERNIATKLRMEGQKNVATFDILLRQRIENARKTLSLRLKLSHDK